MLNLNSRLDFGKLTLELVRIGLQLTEVVLFSLNSQSHLLLGLGLRQAEFFEEVCKQKVLVWFTSEYLLQNKQDVNCDCGLLHNKL